MDWRGKLGKLGFVISMGIATGSSIVFASLALREFQPLTLVALRLLIATLAFTFTLILLGKKIPSNRRTQADIVLVG